MTDRIWVSKYRPQTLDEIIGHDAVVQRMKRFVDDAEMPNLLFAGRQGIGKTAIVQAFAKEKYGDDWKQRFLDLNASDDRGIDIVRDQIKDFARTGAGEYDFKIVFLDEADQLTRDAQPALRRTMEDYADVTRFVLSCNYPNQIIDPIQSRCAVFHLSPLSEGEVVKVLNRVVEGEGIDVEEEALEEIVRVSRGDARCAIHTLHACTLDDELTVEDAQALLGAVTYEAIEGIVEKVVAGDMEEAMAELDAEVLKRGASVDDVLEMFLRVVKRHDGFNPDARVKALDALGRADQRLREGANPHVQYHALLTTLQLARNSSTGGYDR